MKIEIIGHAGAGSVNAPRFSSIPPEHAIRGFFGVTLLEHRAEPTAAILNSLGFQKLQKRTVGSGSQRKAKSSAIRSIC